MRCCQDQVSAHYARDVSRVAWCAAVRVRSVLITLVTSVVMLGVLLSGSGQCSVSFDVSRAAGHADVIAQYTRIYEENRIYHI